MLLSISRQRTLVYLDRLGEKHDAEVIEWKENLERRMTTQDEVFHALWQCNIILIHITIGN